MVKVLKKMIFKKGSDCYDLNDRIKDKISNLINKDFEDENAELKKTIIVSVLIEDGE